MRKVQPAVNVSVMSPQPLRWPTTVGTGLRAAIRSQSRVARSARAIARWSAIAAGLALVIFHIVLFRDRLVGGELLDPVVAVRWLAAAALVSALLVLRRMGIPLASGRKAFIIWLLVALLHASSGGVSPTTEPPIRVDAGLIFVLPSTLTVVGLGLLCVIAAKRQLTPSMAAVALADPGKSCRLSAGWRRGGTTRAPPLASF